MKLGLGLAPSEAIGIWMNSARRLVVGVDRYKTERALTNNVVTQFLL